MKALLLAGAMALATTGAALAGMHGPHGHPGGEHFGPEHHEFHGGHEWHGGPGFHGHGFHGGHWGGPYEYGHRYFYNDRWYDWGEGPCLRRDPYTGEFVWLCG